MPGQTVRQPDKDVLAGAGGQKAVEDVAAGLQPEKVSLLFTPYSLHNSDDPAHPVNPVKKENFQSSPIRPSLHNTMEDGSFVPTGQAIDNIQSAKGGVDPQYEYDLNGNRVKMITPFGDWTYTYDAADRLTKITNPGGEVTTFTYDAIHRRTSATYDNGVVTSYTYDAASRLTNLTTQDFQLNTLNSYTYTYDEVGNKLSMTNNDGTHNYVYSDVYRLVSATHPQTSPPESFTYDPVGNRLTSHLSSAYVYDNLNRLLEDDDYTYTYDANGNLLSKLDKVSNDTTTYQYDGDDRLIQVDTPTDIVLYQYDGFGRRIAKTVNGVVTKYVYDREDILFELDENNQIKARYTHGPGIDEPISVDRDTDGNGTLETTYYYQYDGLGSVTTISDSVGNIVKTYKYDSFGNIVNESGSVENSYTFTAREWDSDAGLYFYRARYYDPNIGRFINGDPIGFNGGDVNFYVYVQNNPVNWIDPVGLIQFKIFENTVDIRLSGTFLGFNPSWDFGGFNKSNFNVNAVLPPLTAGFGLDIKINPPDECSRKKYISPFIGSRHLSIGTNATYNPSTQSVEYKGVNFSIGFSVGTPFGVTVPIN